MRVYVPIVSMLLLSVVLTVLLNLVARRWFSSRAVYGPQTHLLDGDDLSHLAWTLDRERADEAVRSLAGA